MPRTITDQYLDRYQRIAADDGGTSLLPVTGAQRRFVLVRSLDPSGRPDLVPMFFAFPADTVDPVRLRRAANRLAALHPVLRARPDVVRGTPVLRLAEPDVPVEQVVRAPGEDAAGALRRVLGAWEAQGSPLRLYLVQEGSATGDEVLAVVLDHTACDGQSLARIVEELTAAYRDETESTGRGSTGPESTGREFAGPEPGEVAAELAAYREAVHLQLDAERRAGSAGALAYWGDRLRAVHERAPQLRPPTAVPGALPTGAAELRLPAPASGVAFPALLDACRAAARVLYGSGQVMPIGYPWGGRPPGAPPVLGCFLNTVVFPAATVDVPHAPDETATQWWDDLDRADTPFDAVVHAARLAGSPWSGRLDGLLTVDDARRRPALRLGGVDGREVHIGGRQVRAPFAVSVTHGPELHLRMVWDRAVLDDDAARDGFAAFRDAVRAPAPEPVTTPGPVTAAVPASAPVG
ncbi:non-ribosomal peptide synthetase [Streptomyces sp. H39-S7]|uniref:non-ribosomal peptide synthetase n=1 Tax=Streptomyces sp. H39-S7 TaxID=3004357 RepID=UPI0022AEAB73|nr:non-ribosomal peptide synthetase [Streptomyces sp. H39-S7]MCZ4124237.1 non-ribosomal peptide synthetase [Streptomyces sp. H39-S7]